MSLVLTGCATTNAQVVPAPPDTEPEYSTQESVIISGEEYESPEQSLVEAEKAPTPEPTPEPVPEPTPEVTEEPPAEETPVPEEPVSEDNEDTQPTPQEDTPQESRSGERSIPIPVSEVKKYAYEQIVNKYKWDESEFTCVENLWERKATGNTLLRILLREHMESRSPFLGTKWHLLGLIGEPILELKLIGD